jgi:ElaA protein
MNLGKSKDFPFFMHEKRRVTVFVVEWYEKEGNFMEQLYKIKRFENLTTTELYEILRVRAEVFVVEQTCIYQDLDEKDKKAYHFFVEEDRKVVAYLRVLDKGVSYPEISIGRVLVTEENRRKGLARELMEKAIDFIKKDLGENRIRISGQLYLQAFYESLGFQTVSEVYLEDDIPHVEMLYGG